MRVRNLAAVLLAVALCGCETVAPWERGVLAKDAMQWTPNVMETQLRNQVYASKEASSGGAGAAGGGCGCN
jgi:outer membrane PBP1 activator LpoA protein